MEDNIKQNMKEIYRCGFCGGGHLDIYLGVTQFEYWYPFLLGTGKPHANSAVGKIRPIEKSNDLIGNRTRDS
jgi:hypothetical protein